MHRMKELDFILTTEQDFKELDNCTVEGVKEVQVQRNKLVNCFVEAQKRPDYDFLDERNTRFIQDLTQYKNGIFGLENNVLQFAQEESPTLWHQLKKLHQLMPILNRPNLIHKYELEYEKLLQKYNVMLHQWLINIQQEQLISCSYLQGTAAKL